jgi:transcriptional regulator with XRE-family HTH domain
MREKAPTKKTEVSKGVYELRTLLGDSQQAFSNRLGLALNTIARYETSREPTGEVLLLSDLAEQHGHFQLRDFFRTRYIDEVFRKLNFQLLMVPRTKSEPARGYLMLRLEGDAELEYAQSVLSIHAASRSTDSETRQKARAGFAQSGEVARGCNANSLVDDIQHAFRTGISGGVNEPAESNKKPPATKTKKGKK